MARKNPHAVELGRRGGRVRSAAKARAARSNAQRAGRKPKFQIGDRVMANEKAPMDYRGRLGTITQIGPGKSEYGVTFEHKPGFMMSWWIEPLNRGAVFAACAQRVVSKRRGLMKKLATR